MYSTRASTRTCCTNGEVTHFTGGCVLSWTFWSQQSPDLHQLTERKNSFESWSPSIANIICVWNFHASNCCSLFINKSNFYCLFLVQFINSNILIPRETNLFLFSRGKKAFAIVCLSFSTEKVFNWSHCDMTAGIIETKIDLIESTTERIVSRQNPNIPWEIESFLCNAMIGKVCRGLREKSSWSLRLFRFPVIRLCCWKFLQGWLDELRSLKHFTFIFFSPFRFELSVYSFKTNYINSSKISIKFGY